MRARMSLTFGAIAAVVVLGTAAAVSAATTNFTEPGTHEFVVPAGVTQVTVEACGAPGGDGGNGPGENAGGVGGGAGEALPHL